MNFAWFGKGARYEEACFTLIAENKAYAKELALFVKERLNFINKTREK